MKNLFTLFILLLCILTSCTDAIDHKNIYCFLSGTDVSNKEQLHFISNAGLNLNSSGYNVKITKWNDFANKRLKNGSKFIIKRNELPELKKIKGFDQCNVTYLAENETFFLYRYNSTFESKYLGRVEMRSYYDAKSFQNGELAVKVKGKELKQKLNFFRTAKNHPFPVATKKGINKLLKPGLAIESWIKIRAVDLPSEFVWVQNFKNDVNASIFYKETEIKLLDTLNFKSFNTFFTPEHILNSKDQFLNYLWNVKRNTFDIENMQTMVLNPYSGNSRWENKIKSSFVWIPKHQNKFWQKSYAEKSGKTFFHSIKSGKTGMHYSTSLSREPIQTTDSLNVEFEIKSNELLEGSLIVEITNPDNERNIKYSQKIKINSDWNKHSFNFGLTTAKKTDRLFVYFKNDSKGTFKVKKMQGAVVGKFITCN